MILNCFNIIKYIENEIGEFDDSIYIIDYSINNIKMSINSCFDWETLANNIIKDFPQGNFNFSVIGLDLNINW